MKRYHVETFKQFWNLHVEYSSGGGDDSGGGGSGGGDSGSGPASGVEGAPEEKKREEPVMPKPQAKSKLDTALASATAVRKDYINAKGNAGDLIATVESETDPAWAFALNEQNIGRSTAALKALQDSIVTKFRPLLYSTVAQLKKDFKDDILQAMCGNFVKVMQPHVKEVTAIRNKLLARYRVG